VPKEPDGLGHLSEELIRVELVGESGSRVGSESDCGERNIEGRGKEEEVRVREGKGREGGKRKEERMEIEKSAAILESGIKVRILYTRGVTTHSRS